MLYLLHISFHLNFINEYSVDFDSCWYKHCSNYRYNTGQNRWNTQYCQIYSFKNRRKQECPGFGHYWIYYRVADLLQFRIYKLSGLSKSLSLKSKMPMPFLTAVPACSLYSVHCLIPPHPGALAEAGMIKVYIGHLIIIGTFFAISGTLAAYLWSNDFYFWVVSNFSGKGPETTLKVYSSSTIVMGIVVFACVWITSLIIL